MISFKELKKSNYFSDFSGWIENFGVVPLLLLRAFLLLPIFVFLLALLFLVTLVLETIFQLLSVSNLITRLFLVRLASLATRCSRHNFINLQVLQASHSLVKGILTCVCVILQTQSVTGKTETDFQGFTTQDLGNELREFTMAKGELMRLQVKGLIRFSVGNKEVLKVRALENQTLLLKGQSIGHSDLLIWTKKSVGPQKVSLFVVRKSHQLKLMQVAHSLRSLGLTTTRKGNLLRLSGEINSLANYRELVNQLKGLTEKVELDDLQLSGYLSKVVFADFLAHLAQFQLSELNCSPLKLFIRCEASKEFKEKLNSLEEKFLIDWVSTGLLEATRQYRITLVLQQFENSSGEAFNFGLSQVDGKLSSLIFNNPLSLIQENPVSLKKEKFRSKTLAHPVINGRLDFPIKVRIGQQIPFLQSISNGIATQQWRFAGLSLNLTLSPFSERLKVTYKTNLSRPSGTGISENLQESMLLVPLNKTVVLFDIGFRVNQNELSKLPGLGDIPLFGTLFSGNSQVSSYKKVLCLITIEEI